MVRMAKRRRVVRLRALPVLFVLALAMLAAGACDRDAPLAPPDVAPPDTKPVPTAPGGALGLVEVTITGIGTANPSATAVPYGTPMAGALTGPVGGGARIGAPAGRTGTAAVAPGAPGGFGATGPRLDLDAVTDNTALALDGAGDYVRADGVANDVGGAAALTLEAWVRPDAESGGQQTVFAFHTSAGDNRNVLFYEPDRDGFAYHDVETSYVRTGEAFPPGRWVHVTLVIDASDQVTLYIDGTPESTFTTTIRPDPGGHFSIGQEYDGGTTTDFLRGRIDEVRVWNVARSEAEIQADMAREIDPATPGLVSYYRFGGTSGTSAADLAGDNDATLVGGPTLGATGPALDGATNGDGTIQLEPVSTGSFTSGERGAGGYRYLYSTFRVRNAQEDGTAYGTPRHNLTFLAVDTDGTHGHTAVSKLITYGGTEITGAAAVAIAEGMIPTGAAYQRDDGAIFSIQPDVLQALTEAQAAAVELAGTAATDVFPYGFVVRTPGVTPGTRTLPGSPAAKAFDGLVTFAFKVPLEATPAEDPFEIRMVFLPVEDSETRLTQSLEEQGPQALADFEARAAELGASEVMLLPGGDYDGAVPLRMVCEPVRVAGPAGAATGLLFPDPPVLVALSPDPYAPDGAGSRITGDASIGATFDDPVPAVDATSFVVRGAQSGTAFLGGAYAGAGTAAITTPAGDFFPGERVEVTLTTALGFCPTRFGRVVRYRVAAGAAGGTFAAAVNHDVANLPRAVTAGDLDGDGDLDLAVTSATLDAVSVLLNDGTGAFAAPVHYSVEGSPPPDAVLARDLDADGDLDLVVPARDADGIAVFLNDGNATFAPAMHHAAGDGPVSVAAGDLDADGDVDLAVTNPFSDHVSVLRNHGDATFAPAVSYPAGDGPEALATADLDGDGDLDLAVANSNEIRVLLNDGDGAFVAAAGYAVHDDPRAIAAGDLDADGDIDLAVANNGSDDVSVLLGDGDATFAAAVHHPTGDSPSSVAIADVDGDGDLDLAVIDSGSSTGIDDAAVLLNDGDGGFAAAVTYFAGGFPRSVAAGDLDGDGDLDLAVASGGDDGVSVLRNKD